MTLNACCFPADMSNSGCSCPPDTQGRTRSPFTAALSVQVDISHQISTKVGDRPSLCWRSIPSCQSQSQSQGVALSIWPSHRPASQSHGCMFSRKGWVKLQSNVLVCIPSPTVVTSNPHHTYIRTFHILGYSRPGVRRGTDAPYKAAEDDKLSDLFRDSHHKHICVTVTAGCAPGEGIHPGHPGQE